MAGVKQTGTTVTYRFSQPGRPMPLVLPQSYNPGRAIRIPAELNTVGDHIRRERLDLKMLQREAAEQIGACRPSVFTWEANTVSPEIRAMSAIIRGGYKLGRAVVTARTSPAMTQGEAAKHLGYGCAIVSGLTTTKSPSFPPRPPRELFRFRGRS